MKKLSLHSALAAVVFACLSEYNSYLKNWRPTLISMEELISIGLFSLFLFFPILVLYFALKKIISNKANLTNKFKLFLAALAMLFSLLVLYFDDGNGFNSIDLEVVIAFLFLSWIIFIVTASSILLLRKVKVKNNAEVHPTVYNNFQES